MSSPRRTDNALQELLEEAESDLSRRLHEACEAEARGVSSDSSAEIRRLEDTLLAAAMAAERTLAARRHLDAETASDTTADESMSAADTASRTAAVEISDSPRAAHLPHIGETETNIEAGGGNAVREFEDESGRSWRAWPVTPNLARAREASRRSLGDFQEGWICFEAMDNSGRRRLPRMGRRWSDLPAEELPRLLAQAINVPSRKAIGREGGAPADELH
jgi:hypothetical protein